MVLCDGNYDWVHMACTRCIIGNPSEAGYPSSLYYKRRSLYLCSAKAPVLDGSGVAANTIGKVIASTVFMSCLVHVSISDFLLFVKNGFVVGVRTLNVTAGH